MKRWIAWPDLLSGGTIINGIDVLLKATWVKSTSGPNGRTHQAAEQEQPSKRLRSQVLKPRASGEPQKDLSRHEQGAADYQNSAV
jgi:hypothetical protein